MTHTLALIQVIALCVIAAVLVLGMVPRGRAT